MIKSILMQKVVDTVPEANPQISNIITLAGSIITCVVTVISIFISNRLGRNQSELEHKRAQAKHRYETFYIPFFTKLYAGHLWGRKLSSLGFKSQCLFFDMISHNISMLGYKTQALYPDIYDAFLKMLSYHDGESGYDNAPDELDRVFSRFVSAAAAEARDLSQLLHLPSIACTFEKRRKEARRSKRTRTTRFPRKSSDKCKL